MKTLIANAMLVTPYRVVPGGVLVEDGRIAAVLEGPSPPGLDARVVDAGGQYFSPGFIDIHVHGGGGLEVMGASAGEIAAICAAHARYGTTSLLPTTLAAPLPDLHRALENIRQAKALCREANILGTHLEGPFLSFAQRGAQAPEHLLVPDAANIAALLDGREDVRLVGAAPELPGGLTLGRELAKRGIPATIAHSDADFDTVCRAAEHGYTDITHLYSGCSHVHREGAYRVAGVVEAGLYLDSLTVQVIADGRHLPPALLRLIVKCKGADRIALVSDGLALAATEAEEGTVYTQGNGVPTVLEDGVMKLLDRASFAGSIATMSRLVANMAALADVPLADAVRMATLTPARIIGEERRKGALAPGMDADLILFGPGVEVSRTMVMGRWIDEL